MKESRIDQLRHHIVDHFKPMVDKCIVFFSDSSTGANSICRVHLERSYQLGNAMSFSHMKWLSDLLHTDKINIEDQTHTNGCDTCDWGSYDAADLVAYDCDPLKD